MQILKKPFHPQTGEILMRKGVQNGLVVLESRRTGETYLLRKTEGKFLEKSTPSRGGVVVPEYSRMPAPCPECGSRLGNLINETLAGMGSDEDEVDPQLRHVYRCDKGHAFRY